MNFFTAPLLAIAAVLTVGAVGLSVVTMTGQSFKGAENALSSRTELNSLLVRAKSQMTVDLVDGLPLAGKPSAFTPSARLLACAWNSGPSRSTTVGAEQYLAGPAQPTTHTPVLAFIHAGLNGTLETGCAAVLARAENTVQLENGDDIVLVLAMRDIGKEAWTNADDFSQASRPDTLRSGQILLRTNGSGTYLSAWDGESGRFLAPTGNPAAPLDCNANPAMGEMLAIPQTRLPSGKPVGPFCVQRFLAAAPATPEASLPSVPGFAATQMDAQSQCQAVGLDLMTNEQWQALAKLAAANPANWTSGAVGEGSLMTGVAGSGKTVARHNARDDADPYAGSGEAAPSAARRTLFIGTNSRALWDFTGNWQWTANRIARNLVVPSTEAPEPDQTYPFLPADSRPALAGLTTGHGIGSYYGSTAAPFTLGGVAPYHCTFTGACSKTWELGTLRGGDGLYGLRYAESPAGNPAYFRCTFSPA